MICKMKEPTTKFSDFDKFKKFFDDMGIKYKVNGDCIYLDAFATRGGLLVVVDFYDDGKFQCFSPYPDIQARICHGTGG